MCWVVWLAGFAVVALAILYSLSLRFRSDRKADEIHFAKTTDGWPIALHRYLPRGKKRNLLPVVFAHGLGANRFNFDLDDRHSLAVFLADRGYDVFLLEVRGVGWSRKPGWFASGRWDICFDDFVSKDIPTAIDWICDRTGKKQVHWIGHSMGAMLSYALAQFDTAEKVHSVCAIAGPGDWRSLQKSMSHLLRFASIIRNLSVVHNRFFCRLYTPLMPSIKKDVLRKAIFERENMKIRTVQMAAVNLVSDNPVKLLLQFAGWIRFNEFSSLSGYSYRNNLNKVRLPICFLSGEKDYFADYHSVRSAYEAVSSPDKKHVHFSKKNGTLDFGHGDIVLGDRAPEIVYPVVEQWLEDHR